MTDYNPYAPPRPDAVPLAEPAAFEGGHSHDVAEAIHRLNEHLSDPARVAQDRADTRRFTIPQLVIAAVVVVIGGVLVAFIDTSSSVTIVAAVVFGVLALIAFAAVVLQLRITARARHTSPDVALRAFLVALPLGRNAFAVACLGPLARMRPASAPSIPPLPSVAGEFSVGNARGMGKYACTFCRPGHGQVRTMRVRRASIYAMRDDVADVEIEADFQTWPRWANIVSIIAFLLIRVLGAVVGAVLYFSLRKRARVVFTKRMIRGRDGLWYLLDARLFEPGARVMKV
jgi:hypothetical protein